MDPMIDLMFTFLYLYMDPKTDTEVKKKLTDFRKVGWRHPAYPKNREDVKRILKRTFNLKTSKPRNPIT